jgi:type II secretory pathway component GspD/PulD (secretin)
MQGMLTRTARSLLALSLVSAAACLLFPLAAQSQTQAPPSQRADLSSETREQVLDLLAQGDTHYNARDYEQALRLYEQAGRLDPDSPQIRHRLRLAQQREAARQRFLLTVPAEPRARAEFTDQHYSEALQLLNEHRLEAAHQRLEEVFFLDPHFRRVEHYLAQTERDLAVLAAHPEDAGGAAPTQDVNLPAVPGEPSSALSSILVTPGLPTHDDLMTQGEALMEQGDAAGAYEAFTQALMTDPNSRAARRARERAARIVQRESGISDRVSITDARSPIPDQRLAQARAALDAGQFEDARALFNAVLADDPQSTQAQDGILAVEQARANASEVERSHEIAMNIERGRTALDAGQFDSAQTAYEAILALDPDQADAQAGLQRLHDAREAAAQQALEQTFQGHLDAAQQALDSGDLASARDRATQAQALLADDPALAHAHADSADRLIAQIERAETAAEQAARQAAEAAQHRDTERAAAQSEAAVRQALDDGRRALRQDNYTDAIQSAEAALALDPTNDAARRLREDAVAARDAAALAQRQAAQTAAEQDNQQRIESLLDQARQQLRDEHYDQAIQTAEQVFAIQVDNPDAQRLINDAREARDDAARQTAEQEQQQREDQIQDLIRSARRDLRRENFHDAMSAAEQVLAMDPESEAARGIVTEAQAGIAEATRQAAEAARETQISDLLTQARQQLRDADYPSAITTAQRVLDLDAANEDAQALIARARDEQTRAQTEQQAAEQEQRLSTLLDQARAEADGGQPDTAMQTLQQAAQIAPDDRRVSRAMTRVQRQIDQMHEDQARAAQQQQEAEARAAREQQEQAQSTADSETRAGRRSARHENWDEAIQHFQAALAAVPDHAPAQEGLAAAQQAKSQAEAEAATAQQAQQDAQREVAAGNEALQSSDFDAAEEHFRSAQTKIPDMPEAAQGLQAVAQARQSAEQERQAAEAATRRHAEQEARARQRAEAQTQAQPEAAPPAPAPPAPSAEMITQAQRDMAARAGQQAAATGQAQAPEAAPPTAPAPEAAPPAAPMPETATPTERTEAQEAVAAEAQREAERAARQLESQQRSQSEALADEAATLREQGDLDGAEAKAREALALWSENRHAQRELDRVIRARSEHAEASAAQPEVPSDVQALVNGLLEEGRQAYSAGDVITAVERWNRVLALDPNNDYALTYLARTDAEYRGAVAMQQAQAERASREATMQSRLSTPITITTPPEGTPLQVFLDNISVFTEINFVIAQGVDVQVTGSFVDQPLRQVLDAVISANGLTWKAEDSIITISASQATRFYQLTSDQTASLVVMRDSGFLDQLLYPPDGVRRVAGQSYELDDVTGTFVITGSPDQIQRVDQLLTGLTTTTSPNVLVTRIYKVRQDEGERIKTLIEAILEAERTPQTQGFERTIILQGENLIVSATEHEHQRVEEILAQYGQPGQGLAERGLEVATFSLIPRRVLQQNEEVARDLAEGIKETVEVLLYSGVGVDAARRQGRRLWFDEYTLQLTVTDTPDNIEKVTRYISSIPTLEPHRTTRIVYLNHQQASSLVGKLEDFLDIEIRGGGGGEGRAQQGGNVVVRTLRADDEFTFRDLRVTLVEVVENDVNNDRDEDVTLLIDTPTTSEERTIKELRSEIVDDYRVRIVDARASGNRPNSGRAEVEITYLGPGGAAGTGGTGGTGAVFQATPISDSTRGPNSLYQAIPATAGVPTGQQGQGAQGAQGQQPQTPEEARIPVVQPDDDTNSVLISVVNPGDLALIEEAIKLLDIPILQAQIETKFVEVNENRARELKSEMSIAGIGREGINFSDSFFSARYAQDVDEFRNVFEPSLESPTNANLLKGTTVLQLITGGRSPLTWELAFLEAEGVINTVNGPFIVAQNNQGADFTITQQFNRFGPIAGVTNFLTTTGQQQQTTGTIVAGNAASLLDIELVDMSVTPTISQSGFITLDIDVDISNFSNMLGQLVTSVGAIQGTTTGGTGGIGLLPNAATQNVFGVFSNNRKELQTTARVHSGGTIILGGWTLERVTQTSSGIPVLRNLPYIGQLFFSRNQDLLERLTLLIFLTARIVDIT